MAESTSMAEASTAPTFAVSGSDTRIMAYAAGIALIWFATCMYHTYLRYQFWILGIDVGGYAQLLARYGQGLGWTYTSHIESLEPINLFNYHCHVLLYPLYAIYKLFPHPLVLFVVQHGCVAVGSVIMGLLALRLGNGQAIFAILTTLVFLLFPQNVLSQTAMDFSFRHMSLLFVPLSGLAMALNRPRLVVLGLLLMVLGTEELALSAAFFLIACAWLCPAHRKLFLGASLFFLAYLLVLLGLGMNHHALDWRYSHFQQGIGATAAVLFSRLNMEYLLCFLVPVIFLPLVKPTPWLLACIPGAAQVLLTSTLDTHSLGHHHSAVFFATLFLANIHSLASLQPERRRVVLLLQVLGTLSTLSLFSLLPMFDRNKAADFAIRRESFEPLLTAVGKNDSLTGPTNVATHFWELRNLYFFPMHAETADWVVVPTRPLGYPPLALQEIPQWLEKLGRNAHYQLVLQSRECFVFRRKRPGGIAPSRPE